MDFHSNDGGNVNSTDVWQWQHEEEYCLSTYSQFGSPLWDDNSEKGESLPYTMGNQTPLRGFGDFDLEGLDFGDDAEKGVEEAKEASRVKRRRVLNFFSDDDGATAVNEHLSSEVREDSTSAKICTQNSQSNLTCSDDRFLFSNEVLDPSSDEWMDNYFNDSEMSSSMNDHQVKLKSQIDVSDFLTEEPDKKTKVLPNPPKSSTLRIFKGRKSHINYLTKLTTSVAYPFTLIKQSQIQGHMTLKDINQRIHSPPSSRARKETVDDDPSVSYPTSAFSGKPVIVKTKILTEGGKGSITILRTKG